MKTIAIVLTKYNDPLSKLTYVLTGFGYTHASLALDESCNEMYSFNFKGFCVETYEKHKRRGVTHSRTYQIRVSDAAYARLQSRIRHFVEHKPEYSYTKLGVVLSFLHIPCKLKKRYFCSQFVAETLLQTGAFRLRKAPSLYMPNHFCRELAHSVQLQRIQYNPV